MYGYQQTAYNYGTYASANGQQANFVGYGQQQANPTAAASSITPMGTAANAYANSQYSLAAAAYAQYGQAAQQQQAASVAAGYGIQPPPPPPDYSSGSTGAYGVIGGGKPRESKATGSNAVTAHYAGYESAVYAAASNYVQGGGRGGGQGSGGGWKGGRGGFQKKRYGLGHQNRDVQQLFCELCKISCAGQAAYKDHMDGKPHKKKEQSAKELAQQAASRGRVGFRCEVCELTCASKDTFEAHVKGQKHQRTIALLRRMGKPVPEMNMDNGNGNVSGAGELQGQPIPTVGASGPLKKVVGVTGTKFVGGTTLLTTGEELKAGNSGGGGLPAPSITGAVKPQDLEKVLLGDEDVKPIGQEFIEEEKEEASGKFLTYHCKLCDCKFSDIGAKDVHLKGRRHRLNYKQKVDPSLKVEVKGTWGKKGTAPPPQQQHIGAYTSGPAAFQMAQQPRPVFPMQRNQEIMDDKHVLCKLQQIQLGPEEMGDVERLALLIEKTLKTVSDSMVNAVDCSAEQVEQNRVLKGVMRVGLLAKHLLIKSDQQIDLVVLCSTIPTVPLLKQVAELFKKHAQLPADDVLTISELLDSSAFSVSLSSIPIVGRVTLTSVALREGGQPEPSCKEEKAEEGGAEAKPAAEPLPKEPCLKALAELRHAKFYQVKCASVHSLNTTVKIVRDICLRVLTWSEFTDWAVELLVEKALVSIAMPLSPGDAVRRIFEVISSSVFLNKRSSLADPCEKEPVDVLGHISEQGREDIASSAQHALRLIAYNQIYKILGIERLAEPGPPPGSGGAGGGATKGGGGLGMKRRADGSSAAAGAPTTHIVDEGGQDRADLGGGGQPVAAVEHPAASAGRENPSLPAEAPPEPKKGKIEQPEEAEEEEKKTN